jgi:hypothetical protein
VKTGMQEGRGEMLEWNWCWRRRNRILFKAIKEGARKKRVPARGEPSRQTICQDLPTVLAQTRKVPVTQLVANALIGCYLLVMLSLV